MMFDLKLELGTDEEESRVAVESTLGVLESAEALCRPLLAAGYVGWCACTQAVARVAGDSAVPGGALVVAELVHGARRETVRLVRDGARVRRTTVREGEGEPSRRVLHTHLLNTDLPVGVPVSRPVATTAVYWQRRPKSIGGISVDVWEPVVSRLVSIGGV